MPLRNISPPKNAYEPLKAQGLYLELYGMSIRPLQQLLLKTVAAVAVERSCVTYF